MRETRQGNAPTRAREARMCSRRADGGIRLARLAGRWRHRQDRRRTRNHTEPAMTPRLLLRASALILPILAAIRACLFLSG